MSQTVDAERPPLPALPLPVLTEPPSRRLYKRGRQWLVRMLFQTQLATLRVLPWKPAIALGEGMGLIAFRVSARYRGIAQKNLRIAYGDTLSESERRRLVRRVFQNFARAMLIEWLKVPSLTSDRGPGARAGGDAGPTERCPRPWERRHRRQRPPGELGTARPKGRDGGLSSDRRHPAERRPQI